MLSGGAARVLKAEREGFKPPERTSRSPDFESGPIGHSGISPSCGYAFRVRSKHQPHDKGNYFGIISPPSSVRSFVFRIVVAPFLGIDYAAFEAKRAEDIEKRNEKALEDGNVHRRKVAGNLGKIGQILSV